MAHSHLTSRAKAFRTDHTNAERLLWYALRARRLDGWKFKRQVPRGPYIVDFLCVEANLVVEVDGYTHCEPHELAYDARRTAYLESQGLRVVRVTNPQVYESIDGACRTILAALGDEPLS